MFTARYGMDLYTVKVSSALCLFSSAWDCYQKDKRAKPGNLANKTVVSEIGEHWVKKYLRYCFISIVDLTVREVVHVAGSEPTEIGVLL